MIFYLTLLPKLAFLVACTMLFIWVMSLATFMFYVEMNKIILEFKREKNQQ